MNRVVAAMGAGGLLLCACSSAPVSPTCSDEAYMRTAATCAAAVGSCLQNGGTDTECETVCDEMADAWERRCSQ